jgi:hypothetical protein
MSSNYSPRNVRSCIVAASLLLTGGLGCNADAISPPNADANSAQRTGNLQGHFEAGGSLETSCGTVAGIYMSVDGPGVSRVWCDAEFENFDPADDTTEYDYVADCFFVVKPGMWAVDSLEALDGDGNTMDCCTSVLPDPVLVGAYETSEVQGAITCDVDQNGALDVIVTINVPPVIVDLDYFKFGSTCSAISIHAEAQDADGGEILYAWEVTEAPVNAEYHLVYDGPDATFAAKTLGDYELRVTATDDQGASTYLDFPIHIVDDSDLQCDLEDVCES